MSPTAEQDNVTEIAAQPVSGTDLVIATAKAQIGKPYKIGAEGPDSFDCSGLVWYCFSQNKLGALIGGGRHRANWYYNYFKEHNWFTGDRSLADVGDLVFYGYASGATHMGLYLGNKRRPLISALTNPYGVSRTRLALLNVNGQPLPILGYGQVQYAT